MEAGIWEHITPELILQGIGVLLAVVGVGAPLIYKFGKQDRIIFGLLKRADKLEEVIKSFHGTCDVVKGRLDQAVSYEGLRMHCEKSQGKCTHAVCLKIKGVENKIDSVKESARNLELKFDHSQEVFSESMKEIVGAIGELKGEITRTGRIK